MFNWRPWMRAAILVLPALFPQRFWAAPPLTVVQDTLYKADGRRFNGLAVIEYMTFNAADQSVIAEHSLTTRIVDGVLRVSVVPTTDASPQAWYKVTYNSDGKIQYVDYWAVPPSSVALRLRDVRIPGPPGLTLPPSNLDLPIAISDVTGLQGELDVRPVKGSTYYSGRAAVIAADGTIQSATGTLTDCLRVDGTSGPCGGGGGSTAAFVDGETPQGAVNGTNRTYTLANTPTPASSLLLYRNGILQKQGVDYTLSANTVVFEAASTPQTGDILLASYRAGETGLAGGGIAQVLCSGTGSATNATAATSLGRCTVPANLLQAGDRVEIRFDYSHEGASTGFSFLVRWGATTLVSRTAAASEAFVSGQAGSGIHASGAIWSAQSWGSVLAQTASAGLAPDSLTSPLTIDFLGQMSAPTTDMVTLRNFTVVRYPRTP